jgi:outer membrane scaffolding protein for murein synthesis (MipA/OmpV family)
VKIMTVTARLAVAMPIGLGLLVLAEISPVRADEAGGFNGYLNLGAALAPDFQGSSDYRPVPLIAGKLAYDSYYLELRGPQLRANVMPADILPFGLELGPSAAYRFGRNDVENNHVDDMRDIDGSVAVGGFVKLYTRALLQEKDELGFTVEALTGIGKNGTGTTFNFGPSYSFWPWQNVRLGLQATATYASAKYNETYFGVDAGNALRSGFDTYTAGSGIKDIGLVADVTYIWTEHWSITATAGITRLTGDAADSPIVKKAGSATQGIVGAGVVYHF